MSAKAESSKPSPKELVILKALWKQSPMGAKEIHEQVSKQLKWSYSSTRKTLDRMISKDLIQVKEVHGIRVFSSTVGKVRTLASYIKDFARSVLEVDTSLPVSMFADSKLLDDKELKELEDLLNQRDSEHD
ncbi:BlaI/MecI/CopY family transcriptional regulator [Pleionea litopenaei]|uniref:BlaI/MecI/CopY family transcriptional regulator n=1 Tax=Pleionea litopenaei TaxID=3070815 RepID=A0AA51X6F2_9GAMM|nr:BlaI/MecI/CopY family transcriptional regulator [Pleionea sp. HL-JVS1]WMS87232.1 BlaI/MecI/CopY family transcriptional regulator [Pleionea sp. HL-JVS1]